MKALGILVATSFKTNLRLKAVLVTFIFIALLCAGGIAITFCLLFIAPELAAKAPDRTGLELYLGLILYITCLLGMGVNLNSFAFLSLTREKSRGNFESLLATPLKLRDIWMAKSLAVFLPGLVLAEILTLLALIAINYIYFVPAIGFLITPWLVINSFIVVPIIYFCLSLLVYLIGLTGKPATGNIIAQIFLPVIIALMINLMLRQVVAATSWVFTVINLGIAFIILIIVLLLSSRFTVERVVLSR